MKTSISLVTLLLLAGCGDSGPCVPGATQVCLCASAGQGVQSCSSSGESWGACQCSSGITLDGGSGVTIPDSGTPDTQQPDSCVPSCSGKSCGSDGCGGSCGSCTSPAKCCSGQCKSPPKKCSCSCKCSGCSFTASCEPYCQKSCYQMCNQGCSLVSACGYYVSGTGSCPSKVNCSGSSSTSSGFGAKCSNSNPCASGYSCITYSGASYGFCTKECYGSGTACSGTPSGTEAYCIIKTSSGTRYCAFMCKYKTASGTKTVSCPSELTCASTADPVGSGQHSCDP